MLKFLVPIKEIVKETKLSEPIYSGKHGSDIRQTKGKFSLRQPTTYRQENQ